MNSSYSKLIRIIHLSGDILLINISFLIGYFIKFDGIDIISDDRYLSLLFVFNLAWLIATYVLKTYDIYRVTKYEKIIINLLKLFILQTLILTAFWVMKKAFYYSREQIMWTYILVYFLVSIWRIGLIFSLKKYRKKGYNYRRIIIIGGGELSEQLLQVIERNTQFGYKILGVFSDTNTSSSKILGKVSDVDQFAIDNKVDEIYCSISDLKTEQISHLTEFSDNNLMRLKLLPDVRGFANRQVKIDFYEHIPVLLFRNIPLDEMLNRILKRIFDIIFSSFIIVFVMSWLYPLLAVLIKSSSPGPVLFKQIRSGKNNENFWCWKFRTMQINEDSDKLQAKKGDNRITKIGAFMRKTSLDEFPQFFNVLRGRMSVVGPRPHMVKHTEEYSSIINKYMVRHYVKPGITGLAQVKGFRGETKDPKMMENRVRMDMVYIESWSFFLDLRIVLQTVLNAFKKEEFAY